MFGFVLTFLTVLSFREAISKPGYRFSDPQSFSEPPVAPIPIGTPDEVSQDVVGEPISLEELLYPPLLVDSPNEGIREDPTEKAGLFEGDIIVRTVDEFLELTDRKTSLHRNAVKKLHKLWPDAVIPYLISSSFERYERGAIALAMRELQDKTCIRFEGKTTEKDYIHMIKADGCSSSVGRIGGLQVVSLGRGCLTKGVVIHELMHSMGFWHEQSRPDRDSYITIIWNNIQDGLNYNFGKYDWDTIQNLTVEYDLTTLLENCKFWASKGECKKNRPYMVKYCLTACNEQEEKELNNICEDDHPKCKLWASQSQCEANPDYMLIFCEKSCNQCPKSKRKLRRQTRKNVPITMPEVRSEYMEKWKELQMKPKT